MKFGTIVTIVIALLGILIVVYIGYTQWTDKKIISFGVEKTQLTVSNYSVDLYPEWTYSYSLNNCEADNIYKGTVKAKYRDDSVAFDFTCPVQVSTTNPIAGSTDKFAITIPNKSACESFATTDENATHNNEENLQVLIDFHDGTLAIHGTPDNNHNFTEAKVQYGLAHIVDPEEIDTPQMTLAVSDAKCN